MKEAQMGAWESQISADMVVEQRVKFNQIQSNDQYIYWSELRPYEAGKSALVRYGDGKIEALLPEGYSAKTKVHEYGGGDFLVGDNKIFFSNQKDQRLYELTIGEKPRPVTPFPETRFADGIYDAKRKLIYSIHESGDTNTIVSIDPNTKDMKTLFKGKNFYSSLQLSPDGNKLCFLSWNHPNMPWDETLLSVASLAADGKVESVEHIAGGEQTSIYQPQWSEEGILYYVSDRTGFWNIYSYVDGQTEALHQMEADFGMPQWQFGFSSYAFLKKGSRPYIVCNYVQKGTGYLALIDVETKEFKPVKGLPFTSFHSLHSYKDKCVFIGASPTMENAVIELDPFSGKWTVIKKSAPKELEAKWISIPKMISFPTTDGDKAHAVYYPPKNPDYKAKGEKTPVIIRCHGGPTSHVMPIFQIETEFWTSRGFAYVELNYRGSTGYGRAYRDKLKGKWGMYDVDDAVKCTEYLVKEKLADPNKLIIKGGSAGGYTTLAALTFRDVFKVGASYYGVSDLEALVKDTHKFEKHYLDGLIGKYPEEKNLYYERSPIHFIDSLNVPVILFQGSEDKVVPPDQSEKVYNSLLERNIPVEYILFQGEGHGFRMGESKKTALTSELAFYQRVLGMKK